VCIASKAASMTEIAGPLIEYFSPFSSDGCLELIERYNRPAIRQAKEAEINASYKPHSWDQTFQQVNALVKKLAS